MCPQLHLCLEALPWPVNILSFNRTIDEMKPGDHLVATVKDVDIVKNLKRLTENKTDLHCDVCQNGTGYRMNVAKKS